MTGVAPGNYYPKFCQMYIKLQNQNATFLQSVHPSNICILIKFLQALNEMVLIFFSKVDIFKYNTVIQHPVKKSVKHFYICTDVGLHELTVY